MRYEKGHKDTSRQRIMDVAAERFRSDGIAASGLAGIMSDAGLTNGAFYPHFKSKADLVRDSLAAAMEDQSAQLRAMVADGGLEAVIAAYLSPEHRDNPQIGCTLSALLPELARQPLDTRLVHMERILDAVSEMARALPDGTGDREAKVIGIYATLIGTLQLARAVHGTPLSERVLAAGADAARELVRGASGGSA
ncbi:TetR/AcrR family transcriptional regulator [Sphingomonas sp. Root241]|uniref:TetR/AcrR family transcriptional regulator n=1 Tax=Sphingomonas sp. Root241 TaxID=1736501 RepID=UPI0006FA63FF|nr:TetR/AcrR family transcriptional regulator [Sphingomonas sp. Root241]KRC80061.1 TetR family transcriptional regulator [Sphingomonas sp. Root241]